MNKVVCNICGTSYPENATQCPICGFVRTADKVGTGVQSGSATQYTYVKGGRFSKANVKKRNQANSRTSHTPERSETGRKKHNQKSNAGQIIIIVILLLAIFAVAGYIALRFFLPNDFLYEGLANIKLPVISQTHDTTPQETEAAPPTVNPTIPCSAIVLHSNTVEFTSIGDSFVLQVSIEPADCTDTLMFTSADNTVATVDANGVITAVGEGSTQISVSCGNMVVDCTVTCIPETTVPEETAPAITLTLNRKEITFDSEGQSWIIYDGSIPVSEIVWSSDDNNIATISDGKVVAVANGDTVVYGSYGEQIVSCIIHCNFVEETTGSNNGITEAGGNSSRVYKLYNPYGNAKDVTIKVDEKFTLKLVDENKTPVSGAQWTVKNPNVCSCSDGTVQGLKSGYTEVVATYEGKEYTCIVRVN